MRRIIMCMCLLCVFALGVAAPAMAQSYGPESKRFGIGLIAGIPSGLTLKGYLSPRMAVSGIVSWSFIEDAFTLIGDLTWELGELPVDSANVTVPFYAGVGGRVGFDQRGKNDGKTLIGIRAPIGIAAQWSSSPVELFLEVGPGIELSPSSEFDITAGLGARYYF